MLTKKEQQLQQKSVTQSQSEYSFLQHKKVDDIALPVCSPQLYSILDSPHRTVPTSGITKHASIDLTTPVTAEYSSDSSYDSSDDDKHRRRQRHKPFQPIVYLPPKSSSERKHGNKRIRKHHRDDSGMAARSVSSGRLKKNEYLVQGTTLDGSVTLYAASPVGSPIPPDQAGPILNRLSSRPISRQDHITSSPLEQYSMTSQPLSHSHPHQSVEQQRSLEQPGMMQQQHWNTPPVTSVSQPVSTSASLTTSIDLPDHQQHQGQKLRYSLPPTVTSFDHSDQPQDLNASGNQQLSTNYDQHTSQNSNNNRSLTGNNDTRQDQLTSNSLYQDMLELMQKRETELTVRVNTITADKERLQAEKTLLQHENESSRKLITLHMIMSLVLSQERQFLCYKVK